MDPDPTNSKTKCILVCGTKKNLIFCKAQYLWKSVSPEFNICRAQYLHSQYLQSSIFEEFNICRVQYLQNSISQHRI